MNVASFLSQECGEDKLMRQEDLKVALADAVDRVYDKVCGSLDPVLRSFSLWTVLVVPRAVHH